MMDMTPPLLSMLHFTLPLSCLALSLDSNALGPLPIPFSSKVFLAQLLLSKRDPFLTFFWYYETASHMCVAS